MAEKDAAGHYTVRVMTEKQNHVEFRIEYSLNRGGCKKLVRHFRITPDRLTVLDEFKGHVKRIREYFPFLLSDGTTEAKVSMGENGFHSSINDCRLGYRIKKPQQAIPITASSDSGASWLCSPFRNGTMGIVCYEIDEQKISFKVTLDSL